MPPPKKPAYIIYNGKMITLTPEQVERMPVTGYKVGQYGSISYYDPKTGQWTSRGIIGDARNQGKKFTEKNLLDNLEKYQEEIMKLMKLPQERIDQGVDFGFDWNDQKPIILSEYEMKIDKIEDEPEWEDEEEEFQELIWKLVVIPIFLPNGIMATSSVWQCPRCAAMVPQQSHKTPEYGEREDWAKEHHEKYHKTVACDWFGNE